MQMFANDPQYIVEDMLKGYAKAHSDIVAPTDNPRVFKTAQPVREGKVGIVTGGGSGHKPAFIGYVGRNMVDAVAVGEIFSSPTAVAFYDAIRAADHGNGVACLYGNYAGDNMNVKMAMEMAEDDDIEVKIVVANDDVASAPKENREKRRGVAGGREQFDGMRHGRSLPIYSRTFCTLSNRMRAGGESSGGIRPNVTVRYQRYGSIVER